MKAVTTYSKLIGQRNVLSKLRFYLQGFEKTNTFPHLLFLAARGSGKTMLAEETCRELHIIRKKSKISRPMIEINSGAISTTDEFMNRVILPYVGKETSFILDECHHLPKKLITVLLSMLNPNKEQKNKIQYNNEEVIIDFKMWSFFFCTTEPQLVPAPLKDRLEEISLEAYSLSDLAAIIRLSLLDYKISDEACLELSSYCRGNPRSALKMAQDGIIKYMEVNNLQEFKWEHINELVKVIDLYPLGLTRTEIDLLVFMSKQQNMSLNSLCARSGLGKSAIQNFEQYLTKHDLMNIIGKRFITAKGQKYLNSCKERITV